MYGLNQIGSTLGDFIDAVLHPSVSNLPAGFLVLVFAVLMIAALPEGARQKVRLASLTAVGLIVSLVKDNVKSQQTQVSPRIA
jgi:amino acid permease